jgi:hypothetical protein
MNRRPDPWEARARELCAADGLDPDSRIPKAGSVPAWCAYRDAARAEQRRAEQASLRAAMAARNAGTAPLEILGVHEPAKSPLGLAGAAARAGARESCADFRAGVWDFDPKPE